MTAFHRTDMSIPPTVPQTAPETAPPRPATAEEAPTGPAAAALLAAGIGSAVLGGLTVLAEASAAAKSFLTFSKPIGPLAGKTIVAVFAWAVAWVLLHVLLRRRRTGLTAAIAVTFVLIAIGVAGTFPTVFQAFGH
jgi:hypothetical protein